MLNTIALLGRMVRDPELRRTGSGIAVANFTIAVERDHAGPNKEKETDFIDCVAWRNTGEFISKYFSKGSLIAVKGRLEIRKWTDKDGASRKSAEVNVENAYFAGSKNDNGGSNNNSADSFRSNNMNAFPETQAMLDRYATPVMADDYAMLTDDDGLLPF